MLGVLPPKYYELRDFVFDAESSQISLINHFDYLRKSSKKELVDKITQHGTSLFKLASLVSRAQRIVDKFSANVESFTDEDEQSFLKLRDEIVEIIESTKDIFEKYDVKENKDEEYLKISPILAEKFFAKNTLNEEFAAILTDRASRGELVTIEEINALAKKFNQS